MLAVVVLSAIAVPKVRSFIRAKVAEASSVLRSLRDPRKLVLLVGGNLGSRIVLAVVLSFSLQAFGFRLPLGELLLVNTIVSLFAGLLPIPGGIGVAEAATTAGLVAFGCPRDERARDRDRVPAGHVLPAADLGRRRNEAAAPAGLHLVGRGGVAFGRRC